MSGAMFINEVRSMFQATETNNVFDLCEVLNEENFKF